MTLTNKIMCKLDEIIKFEVSSFEKDVRPTLLDRDGNLSEEGKVFEQKVLSILDSSAKIHGCFSKKNIPNFDAFIKERERFEANKRDPEWIYEAHQSSHIVQKLYGEVAKHNTEYQIIENTNSYGEDAAYCLMSLSSACTSFLNRTYKKYQKPENDIPPEPRQSKISFAQGSQEAEQKPEQKPEQLLKDDHQVGPSL